MQCNSFTSGNDIFHIGTNFGGIPSTLLTNFLLWLLILALFFFARKSLFVLVTDNIGQNWTRIFRLLYSQSDNEVEREDVHDEAEHVDRSLSPQTSNGSQLNHSLEGDVLLDIRKRELARQRPQEDEMHGVFSWIRHSVKCFQFDDETMTKLAGIDGYQYLRFQKYLIVLLVISNIFGFILLPINVNGHNYAPNVTENQLARTTINNRDPNDDVLYIHSLLAFLMFPISMYVMRQFSKGLFFRDVPLEMTRTLLVEKIPEHMCKEDLVIRHFREAYPALTVTSVRLAYDVRELMQVSQKLRDANDAIKEAKKHNENHPEQPLMMKPVSCSRFCHVLCFCTEKVDVMEFYMEEKLLLEREVTRLTEISLHSPLGIAFVTFDSVNSSKIVFDDFTPSFLIKSPKMSTLSSSFRSSKWTVSFAPIPRDIHWQNLKDDQKWLMIKKLMSDLFMLSIIILVTTPEIAVTQLESILNVIAGRKLWQIPEFIKSFLPTLLLWIVGALIPSIICWSVRWLGYWFKSEENLVVMRRIFWYSWLSLIISPVLGLTSVFALLDSYFHFQTNSKNTEGGIRWECLGLPDSGALFINYVITASLVGTGMQLLRVPELLWFGAQVFASKTLANSKSIKRAITFEFRFGEEYAKLLTVFAMVMLFSTSSPLINPVGLLFFILKYMVDKHNLAWVYNPSEIDLNVHRAAINFVIFSVGFIQLYMTFLSAGRNLEKGFLDSRDLGWRSKISLVLLLFSSVVFFSQAFSNFCKRISSISYVNPVWKDMDRDTLCGDYLPGVLSDAIRKSVNESFDEGKGEVPRIS